MVELDADTIRHALETARRCGFRSVRLGAGESKFQAMISKAKRAKPLPRTDEFALVEPPSEDVFCIESPLVGYYRVAGNGLTVGQVVEAGDVIASIAALGLANDVECSAGGEIVEVLVEPNQPVEFGQALARVRAL